MSADAAPPVGPDLQEGIPRSKLWDEAVKEGTCKEGGCSVAFKKDGRLLALATVFRDRMSLKAEAELESD